MDEDVNREEIPGTIEHMSKELDMSREKILEGLHGLEQAGLIEEVPLETETDE